MWGVAFGIVGARLYHVVTSWNELPDEWWGPFAIWKGGLGVWGGIGLGCIVGAIVAKRSGASVARLADCVAPALLVAQGIGRFGNWWNQELFGKPTDLPWGLEIDPRQSRDSGVRDRDNVPPDLPVRGPVVLRRGGRAAADRAPLPGGSAPAASSPSTSSCTASGGSGSRRSASTRRTRSAGIRLNVFVAAAAIVLSAAFFVYWQRSWKRGSNAPPQKVETMAVPKGR